MAGQSFENKGMAKVWLCSAVGARCIYSSFFVWPFNYLANPFNIIFSCAVISESCNDIASSLIRSPYLQSTILNILLWHSETVKSLYFGGKTGQILNFFFLFFHKLLLSDHLM